MQNDDGAKLRQLLAENENFALKAPFGSAFSLLANGAPFDARQKEELVEQIYRREVNAVSIACAVCAALSLFTLNFLGTVFYVVLAFLSLLSPKGSARLGAAVGAATFFVVHIALMGDVDAAGNIVIIRNVANGAILGVMTGVWFGTTEIVTYRQKRKTLYRDALQSGDVATLCRFVATIPDFNAPRFAEVAAILNANASDEETRDALEALSRQKTKSACFVCAVVGLLLSLPLAFALVGGAFGSVAVGCAVIAVNICVSIAYLLFPLLLKRTSTNRRGFVGVAVAFAILFPFNPLAAFVQLFVMSRAFALGTSPNATNAGRAQSRRLAALCRDALQKGDVETFRRLAGFRSKTLKKNRFVQKTLTILNGDAPVDEKKAALKTAFRKRAAFKIQLACFVCAVVEFMLSRAIPPLAFVFLVGAVAYAVFAIFARFRPKTFLRASFLLASFLFAFPFATSLFTDGAPSAPAQVGAQLAQLSVCLQLCILLIADLKTRPYDVLPLQLRDALHSAEVAAIFASDASDAEKAERCVALVRRHSSETNLFQ